MGGTKREGWGGGWGVVAVCHANVGCDSYEATSDVCRPHCHHLNWGNGSYHSSALIFCLLRVVHSRLLYSVQKLNDGDDDDDDDNEDSGGGDDDDGNDDDGDNDVMVITTMMVTMTTINYHHHC